MLFRLGCASVLAASAFAAPLATQFTAQSILEPQDLNHVQNDIINLQRNIVTLALDIVNTKRDFDTHMSTAESQFSLVADGVLPSDLSCPQVSSHSTVADDERAVFSLSRVQSNLADLALHLHDSMGSLDILANDFCNAYAHFQLVQRYARSAIRIIDAEPDELIQTLEYDFPSGEATTLESAYVISRISLSVLKSSLDAQSYPSESVQQALKNADAALRTYKLVANPQGGVQCQPGMPAPTQSRRDAVNRVSILEKAVDTAFTDAQENNGKDFFSFCNIDHYVASVEGFVASL